MAVRVFQFSIIMYWKKEHSHGLKNEPTAGFWLKTSKKGHKKALYEKFSELKVVYKKPRKDNIFFSNFLSFKEILVSGISPGAMSDSVNLTVQHCSNKPFHGNFKGNIF